MKINGKFAVVFTGTKIMDNMYWVIDIGNTKIKVGFFRDDHLVETSGFSREAFLKVMERYHERYPFSGGIVSSVAGLHPPEKNFFSASGWLELHRGLKMNFTNLYATPGTLGSDRMALAAAAAAGFPGRHVLVIDAGTCLTYEYVNAAAEYLGGAISPGIMSRYRALHRDTANLPLLSPVLPPGITGNDTETSMHSGVIYGVVAEIEGVISRYQTKAGKGLHVVLTGGDAVFLANQLKSSIFVRPDFLLYGLYTILKINDR